VGGENGQSAKNAKHDKITLKQDSSLLILGFKPGPVCCIPITGLFPEITHE
jgi:hypothetical protein